MHSANDEAVVYDPRIPICECTQEQSDEGVEPPWAHRSRCYVAAAIRAAVAVEQRRAERAEAIAEYVIAEVGTTWAPEPWDERAAIVRFNEARARLDALGIIPASIYAPRK